MQCAEPLRDAPVPFPRRPGRESANQHAGRARIRGMNVRPVPVRGGVTGETSVNLRQEYIPDGKYAGKTNNGHFAHSGGGNPTALPG